VKENGAVAGNKLDCDAPIYPDEKTTLSLPRSVLLLGKMPGKKNVSGQLSQLSVGCSSGHVPFFVCYNALKRA
jgi:hypothetical protein